MVYNDLHPIERMKRPPPRPTKIAAMTHETGPGLLVLMSIVFAAGLGAPAQQPTEITADVTLDPAKTYGPLLIKASRVTIDGRGAWVVGATTGPAKGFKGDGIQAKGVSGVTLRNVNVKGFETGLHLEDCTGWTVEGCNLSNNFHDPDFDWGENGRRGGIVLERVTNSTFRNNKANDVWDACVLVRSHKITLEGNDFSHTSNTCLKLWNACDNVISRNNLSYGIRIKPGEVHARDSTSVLIESGSDRNEMTDNDCTHGGDGIFVRVLNGWVSKHNRFVGNDTSYAHNNCIEAWSPENTWIRNKANHGSYGFWLGASDKNVLIENEAAWNGLANGNHNSPHLPDSCHAGIVFMFGPSSHTVLRKNDCHDNNGAGIAGIGDIDSKGEKWKAFHWVVDENRLSNNRWGIYLQHADWIDVGPNVFVGNRDGEIKDAGGVTNLFRREGTLPVMEPPKFNMVVTGHGRVGKSMAFAAKSVRDPGRGQLTYRWDFGEGQPSTLAETGHTFTKPGFFRVGVTVSNGVLSSLGWSDVYVTEDIPELATEHAAGGWTWTDASSKVEFTDDAAEVIAGKSSVHAHAEPYGGGRLWISWPKGRDARISLAGKSSAVFWLKVRNENVPAWQDMNPLVTLHQDGKTSATFTPTRDFLSAPPCNEARDGWAYFVVPLAGGGEWKRTGGAITTVNSISLGFDSWGAPPLDVWIDGLAFK